MRGGMYLKGSNLIAYPCCVNEPLRTHKHFHNKSLTSPKQSNKYGIVFALTELAAVIFAALHKGRDQNTLKAEKISTDSNSRSQNPDIPYIEMLEEQMLLTKYTQTLCLSETGTACCQAQWPPEVYSAVNLF